MWRLWSKRKGFELTRITYLLALFFLSIQVGCRPELDCKKIGCDPRMQCDGETGACVKRDKLCSTDSDCNSEQVCQPIKGICVESDLRCSESTECAPNEAVTRNQILHPKTAAMTLIVTHRRFATYFATVSPTDMFRGRRLSSEAGDQNICVRGC